MAIFLFINLDWIPVDLETNRRYRLGKQNGIWSMNCQSIATDQLIVDSVALRTFIEWPAFFQGDSDSLKGLQQGIGQRANLK